MNVKKVVAFNLTLLVIVVALIILRELNLVNHARPQHGIDSLRLGSHPAQSVLDPNDATEPSPVIEESTSLSKSSAAETTKPSQPINGVAAKLTQDEYKNQLQVSAEVRRRYQCPKTRIPDPFNGRVQVYNGRYKHKHRILCWLMAYDGDFPEKVMSELQTWGRRCDGIAVLSNYDDPEWFTYDMKIDESGGKDTFMKKTFACWNFIFQNWRDEYDFFVKADTDTYIIVENLRLYLDKYGRTDTPFYSGRRFQIDGTGQIFVAGAAEILNRPAMDRLVCEMDGECPEPIQELWKTRPVDGVPEMPVRKACKINPGDHADDVMIANCLSWWGVFAEDSREKGQEFFHISTVGVTYGLPKWHGNETDYWMPRYMKWGYLGGEAAVHKYSAVFHGYKSDWSELWSIECELYPPTWGSLEYIVVVLVSLTSVILLNELRKKWRSYSQHQREQGSHKAHSICERLKQYVHSARKRSNE